jgi:small subunit ribosomal protein S9
MSSGTIHGRAYGTGKRKTAIARVFLKPGTGQFTVNGRSLSEYFPRPTAAMIIQHAFEVVEKKDQYDVMVTVRGGGLSGQAEAVRHGVCRALINIEPELRGLLKKQGFLTRDARKKERKKAGQPGARKKFQYSKR